MAKVALVTGSTSGIGLGIAQTLASKGCDIVINGFGDPAAIEAERANIVKTYNVRCEFVACDITKADECDAAIAAAQSKMGAVDILVNNAGIQFTAAVDQFPIDKWQAVLDTNLSGAFYLSRAVLPAMKQRDYGRIINIASAHGLVASTNKAAYVAAKHGIVGLTKVIALENAKQNITCNAICPGWVLTPLVQQQIDARAAKENIPVKQAEVELLSEKQPNVRFAQPSEIGELCVYLLSDAARNVTGTTLSIDGGWTAQ
jgi:3-hydroxybutyrate dehydrogenase